jgi:glycosyltransferase involved in cell wall biosynthesis
MQELVSVVIPSYNSGAYISDAVDSVLNQSYPHLEVIVVDDGSSDETRERLRAYEGRIAYLTQPNRGAAAARNTGIRQVTGTWVALLDADDIWHREKIERQLAVARRFPDVGLLGSLPAARLPGRLPVDPPVYELSAKDFLLSTRMGPSGALIRKRCLDDVGGFDETMFGAEDRDLWLRLAVRYQSLQVDLPCWWYRPHAAQSSRHAERASAAFERVLRKFFAAHPECRDLERVAWAYMYLDGALAYLDNRDPRRSRAFMARSFATWPRPLRDSRRRWLRSKTALRLLLGDRLFFVLAKGLTADIDEQICSADPPKPRKPSS